MRYLTSWIARVTGLLRPGNSVRDKASVWFADLANPGEQSWRWRTLGDDRCWDRRSQQVSAVPRRGHSRPKKGQVRGSWEGGAWGDDPGETESLQPRALVPTALMILIDQGVGVEASVLRDLKRFVVRDHPLLDPRG